jgi:hypothetical protein
MAIIIQEEKRVSSKSIFWILAFVGVIVLVSSFGYYLFFSPAPLADVVGGEEYMKATEFSQIKLDVDALVSTPEWRYLRGDLVAPIQKIAASFTKRADPFETF